MDYKSSYLYLFNEITGLIDQLKRMQQEAEERCIAPPEETAAEHATPKA